MDQISADYFAEEEQRNARQLQTAQAEAIEEIRDTQDAKHVADQFDRIVATLRDIDFDTIWREATDQEKRVMVEEVAMFHDHMEVTVVGPPEINVTLEEVFNRLRNPRTRRRG